MKIMKGKDIKGYISVTNEDKSIYAVKEQFKSEVIDKVVTFPKELGVDHPFNFEDCEKVFKSVGLVSGIINKMVDNIVAEFHIECDDERVQQLCQDFIDQTDLTIHLRDWIKESILKGNGFLEIDLKKPAVRTLNANDMWVVRNKKAEVIAYNQFPSNKISNRFSLNDRKLIQFQTNEIAHLKFNGMPLEAYGYGLLMPNEHTVEFLVQGDIDHHKLMSRKAGAPIHVQVGVEGENTDTGAVDNIKSSLTYMTNRTEWVTDANVKMNVLQFGEIGKNLKDMINGDIEKLAFGMEIPMVILGMANVPEGLAKVQVDVYNRKIKAFQDKIDSIIETQIFKPYLNSQGLDEKIRFKWSLPSEEEKNLRIQQLTTLISNQYLSDGMRREIQLEIGRILGFDEPENLVDTPNTQGMTADKQPAFSPDGKLFEPGKKNEEKPNNEKKKEEEKKQPQVPGRAKECAHIHLTESDINDMSIKEFINLAETPGFNYSDYVVNILKQLKSDKFENLTAITEADLEKGLLNEEQITKLRLILKDAFRKNQTIKQIEKDIKDSLSLKDRITEDGRTIPAESRPNMIARTETLRIANQGLMETYKQNNVEKCSWIAALSDRTCNVDLGFSVGNLDLTQGCEGLNGQIMTLEEQLEIKSNIHPMCRCSASALIL